MFLVIARVIVIVILSVSICVFGIIYCLIIPLKANRTVIFGKLFGCMAPICGIRVEIRNFLGSDLFKKYIYIANHQNNYDMITVAYVVQPNTVTVGKKKLFWIPLFGQLYWLSGNILIDRDRSVFLARRILTKIIETIKIRNMSIWIFPEGTRNRGRGLLPFKTGAFYAAISAKVEIVPICVSDMSNNKIKLSRWSNGLVIIEIMPPIDTCRVKIDQVRGIAAYCHKIMQLKINDLNKEVVLREK
ncbi:1-acyl-glycerol-3-phosphate acyltransferase [Candidatus Blochmanniella floridana]|uniref:1-acyl-sn-glycerol-3-phosphate acyltransferase n=1 Tax=Blochmanniella floridana TaxID=203907 RepID=Q7VQQ3_BLOFL|nr:1-acyl-glycerol-3-phosphate acyltransferase [Candidatus Blochmannia floridanus]